MAMNAYRNYTNNVSAMKANLEKLSSGYKINRAGDDAAGLAISEKMRAQITGLETAQKNAKDGISLVQTAEGALTEVHDMLNRMVTLATQSANGTYDNEVDRNQLQKEMDQLKTEINRIADSANFNGIKLLDGSMDAAATTSTSSVINGASYKDVLASNLKSTFDIPDDKSIPDGGKAGTDTILETDVDGASKPSFKVSLNNVAYAVSNSTTGDTITITIGNQTVAATVGAGMATGAKLTAKDIALAFTGKTVTLTDATSNVQVEYTAIADGDSIKFTAKDMPTAAVNAHFSVSISGGEGSSSAGTVGKYKVSGVTFPDADKATANVKINADVTVNVNGQELVFSIKDQGTNKVGTTAGLIDAMKNATAIYTDDDGNETELVLAQLFDITDSGTAGEISFTARFAGDDDATNDTVALTSDEYVAQLTGFKITGNTDNTAGGVSYSGSVTGTAGKDKYVMGMYNYDFSIKTTATIDVGSVDIRTNGDGGGNQVANTLISFEKIDIADGLKIKLGNTEYTFAVGPDSKFAGAENVVDLTKLSDSVLSDAKKLKVAAATKLTEAAADNDVFIVGHISDDGKISLQQRVEAKDSTDMTTMDKLISYLGISKLENPDEVTVDEVTTGIDGKALTLQIGDTADEFNQLKVDIKDCHVDAMGIGDISIADQESAAKAVDAIKNAINYVSDVRGTLGATQNRLDHTINNLSVMQENIQDAESTIRDVDVAEEMMEYTKNNILIQSAQAMLAQANQVPQGVLQLLG